MCIRDRVLNYACVARLIMKEGHAGGAVVADGLTGRNVEVRARTVVNATGPWSDDLRSLDDGGSASVHGSKGAHIAVPRARLGNRSAITMMSVSYTHLRAHETGRNLVCRLLLEKK